MRFRKPLLIPQIETIKGVDNIEEISQIDFDYYMVGPYDLSASVGSVGDFKSKDFRNAIETLKNSLGSKLGFHLPSKLDEQYENYKDYEFLALGMDSTFLVEKLNSISELL